MCELRVMYRYVIAIQVAVLSAIPSVLLCAETFDELSATQQRTILLNAIAQHQQQVVGKTLCVWGTLAESIEVPTNYMSSAPTEGLRWEVEKRKGRFSFKYDGNRSWEQADVAMPKERSKWEIGYDGSKRIAISSIGRQAPSATITCNLEALDVNVLPANEYADAFRILFFDFQQAESQSYLLRHVQRAKQISCDVTFDGQSTVAISGPEGEDSVTCFFAVRPDVICLGWQKLADNLLWRIAFRYDEFTTSSLPVGSTRTVFSRDGSGDFSSVFAHVELQYDRIEFRSNVPNREFLPNVPIDMPVQDNCAVALSQSTKVPVAGSHLSWVSWLIGGLEMEEIG